MSDETVNWDVIDETSDYAVVEVTITSTYRIQRSSINKGHYGEDVKTFQQAVNLDAENVADGAFEPVELLGEDPLITTLRVIEYGKNK